MCAASTSLGGRYDPGSFCAGAASDAATAPPACDEWYVDDGQVFVRPKDFEAWLRALDAALAKFGATRGTISDGNAKSTARLLCSPGEHDQHGGWDTEHVRVAH